MSLTVKEITFGTPEHEQMLDLRNRVLRKVAVDPDVQSHGTRAALLQASYDVARAWEYKKICCHAREPAICFYLKNDWVEVGDMFDEQGIPHRCMEKELS